MRMLAFVAASIAACTPAATPAEAQSRQQATVLMAEREGMRKNQEEWGYSSAVVTPDTVYLSGVVVAMREGDSDIRAAFDRVYKLIGRTLERAGVGWGDVVDVSSFHTDVEAQVPIMAAVQKQYIAPPFAAWTAIGVSRILGNGLAEIKITARRPGTAATK